MDVIPAEHWVLRTFCLENPSFCRLAEAFDCMGALCPTLLLILNLWFQRTHFASLLLNHQSVACMQKPQKCCRLNWSDKNFSEEFLSIFIVLFNLILQDLPECRSEKWLHLTFIGGNSHTLIIKNTLGERTCILKSDKKFYCFHKYLFRRRWN